MNKCLGCGKLIDDNEKYCSRCFQIKNYNNYLSVDVIDNNKIIDLVNKKEVFTFFLCDFLNLNKKVVDLYKQINNKKIFVISKMDIIPENVSLDSLVKRIKDIYEIDKIMFISIKNNYGIKDLEKLINYYKEVLFVGPSSSGKSSLINYLFKTDLIVSNKQNTTPDFNEFVIDDIKVIDSPGLQVNHNLISKQAGYLKPNIIHLKKGYMLVIDDYKISFLSDNNITLFIDKGHTYKTMKKSDLNNKMNYGNYSDIVIDNIGFIYSKKENTLLINKVDNVEIRDSLVGNNE